MTRFDAEFRAGVIAIMGQLNAAQSPARDRNAEAVSSPTCALCGQVFPNFAALIAHERREDHAPLRLRGRA